MRKSRIVVRNTVLQCQVEEYGIYVKFQICGYSINYCSFKNVKKILPLCFENKINRVITDLNSTLINHQKFIKTKLYRIVSCKEHDAIIRSTKRWIQESEKGIKYFFNLD